MPQKKHSVASNVKKQVRGPELHNLMVDSDEYGQDYRKKHQGQDEIDTRVHHQGNKPEKVKK